MYNFQRWKSFEHPSSTPGGRQTYALLNFFVQNSIWNNFYLNLFLMRSVFLAASSLKLNVLPRFCTLLFFKDGNLTNPLAPIWGRQTYALADFFVRNSIWNNFYLNLFLMRCVFLAASSPKQNQLSHFEYQYVFARDCGVAFLPSWLDTLVSLQG